MHEVRVNERIARVRRGQLRLRRFERVEHGVDAGIAGDVRDHLPSVPVAHRNGGANLLRRQRQEATIRGVVDRVQIVRAGAVRLAHERGAEQNPAIDEDLERTDLQPVIAAAEPERQAGDELLDLGRIFGMRDAKRHGRAHVQPAGALQGLVGPVSLDRCAPFDHARDSGRDVLPVHALEHVERRNRRFAGLEASEHGPDVAKETRRLAAGILDDRASWWIR